MFPKLAGSSVFRIIPLLRSINEICEKRAVGQPQILSRLRFVNIIQRQDETDAEKSYRMEYEALQVWNNEYWAENNERFHREKKDYVNNFLSHIQKDNNGDDQETLSHDQLAPFYRDFLERNRLRNVEYNKVWYKLHTGLLFSALRAKFSRLRQAKIQNVGSVI